jgi:uncharacterized membrane protein YraQ (UPF0718 family)
MTHDEALAELKDISPMDVSWWQALLEWLLAIGAVVIGLGLCVFVGIWLYRMWKNHGPAQQAAGELRQRLERLALATQAGKPEALELMGCMKLLAIRHAGRDKIAGLEGDEWLTWLDKEMATKNLWQKQGGELIKQLYHPSPPPCPPAALHACVRAALEWLAQMESAVSPAVKPATKTTKGKPDA